MAAATAGATPVAAPLVLGVAVARTTRAGVGVGGGGSAGWIVGAAVVGAAGAAVAGAIAGGERLIGLGLGVMLLA